MKKKIFSIIMWLATIAIVVGTVLIVMLSNKNKELNIDDYENRIVTYEEAFKQKEYVYYLYIYRDNCTGCDSIKQNVIDYINGYNSGESAYKLYMLKVDPEVNQDKLVEFDENGNAKSNLYVSNIEDLRISGTPCLLLLQNHTVDSGVYGAKAVSQQLSAR